MVRSWKGYSRSLKPLTVRFEFATNCLPVKYRSPIVFEEKIKKLL
jgi:hypothetical protein